MIVEVSVCCRCFRRSCCDCGSLCCCRCFRGSCCDVEVSVVVDVSGEVVVMLESLLFVDGSGAVL